MLPLLVALSLGANAGPISVVVSSKRPGADTFASKLAARVHQSLVREGFADALDDEKTAKLVKGAGFSDARNCQGGQKCLQKLAVLVGPKSVVIGVDVGKVGKQLAVHLEAISAVDASTLAVSDFTCTVENYGDESAVPVTLFVRSLQTKMQPAAAETPPPVDDKPKPTNETRPVADNTNANAVPPPPPPPMVTETAEPKSRVPAWIFTAATIAAAGAGGTFAALGFSNKGQYDKSVMMGTGGVLTTTLSRQQIDSLGSSVNTDFTVALISGVAALLLAAVTVYFWTAY